MEPICKIKESYDNYVVSVNYEDIVIDNIIEDGDKYRLILSHQYNDAKEFIFEVKKNTKFGDDIKHLLRMKKIKRLNELINCF